MQPSVFQYSNCCHSLHQVTLTESTVILNMTKRFEDQVCEHWHKDFSFWCHWYVHWHKYLLLRDELKILSKLQAFAGNPLCGAVCTDSFEKCTYYFTSITVRMIREMHQSDWEKLGFEQWMQTMYFLLCNTVFTTTNAYSKKIKKVCFQSCVHVYHEFFISLPITFNLVQKCTQELMREEL